MYVIGRLWPSEGQSSEFDSHHPDHHLKESEMEDKMTLAIQKAAEKIMQMSQEEFDEEIEKHKSGDIAMALMELNK